MNLFYSNKCDLVRFMEVIFKESHYKRQFLFLLILLILFTSIINFPIIKIQNRNFSKDNFHIGEFI